MKGFGWGSDKMLQSLSPQLAMHPGGVGPPCLSSEATQGCPVLDLMILKVSPILNNPGFWPGEAKGREGGWLG